LTDAVIGAPRPLGPAMTMREVTTSGTTTNSNRNDKRSPVADR
jgi:hypothetical protein